MFQSIVSPGVWWDDLGILEFQLPVGYDSTHRHCLLVRYGNKMNNLFYFPLLLRSEFTEVLGIEK